MSSTLNLKIPKTLTGIKSISKSKKIKITNGATTLVVCKSSKLSGLKKELKEHLQSFQIKRITNDAPISYQFETTKGFLALVVLPEENTELLDHEGLLDPSGYGLARDFVGEKIIQLEAFNLTKLCLHGYQLDYDELLGSLLGIELARYDYKNSTSKIEFSCSYDGELPTDALKEILSNALAIGNSINLARFLVDVPPSEKRPETYAMAIKALFEKSKSMQVNIWDDKRLKKEGMGLMLGVGGGSVQLPRLVHLKYRPTKARDTAPVAFVGKGITFDTGGLNLKPGNSMRLMKKDMGGSACLVGLASWLEASQSDIPCDIYLALAENSVDAHSFRPSDVLTAKNGMTVEIDNTDAEGRLVMGDALCVASSAKGKDKPQFLIDVATLTGAIKVGLGSDIGGLFSNSDDLAFILQSCSQIAGDPLWRMPLMKSQREKLKSDVADIANSCSGFGGAIRAAMFLQEFTGDIPWAHLDIYAWNDGTRSFYRTSGGSGQGVQCLAQFISQL